jgi:hypothetical protein
MLEPPVLGPKHRLQSLLVPVQQALHLLEWFVVLL